MARDERPVPGLLESREPRALRARRRDDVAPPGRGRTAPGAHAGTESFFAWRLRGAGWISWALAAFALVLAVAWVHPSPLAAAVLWGAAGALCRRCARLAEPPVRGLRALALLGLVVVLMVLLLAGAGFVAHGERA